MLLEGVETLLVLAKEGTMSRAGSRLYISQSAVSKRIARLEKRLGKKLIVPDGRHIKLTPDAQALVAQVGPGFNELKGRIFEQQSVRDNTPITMACSETLVSGYLAPFMGKYLKTDPYIVLSTHHTPVIVERVQSGDATLGFCAGHMPGQHGLQLIHLMNEPFTVVYDRHLAEPPSALLTNDLSNPANAYQAGLLQQAGIKPLMEMDSYTAAAKLALAGTAPALVPFSVVQTLAIPPENCQHFAFLDDLIRPIYLCYRQHSYRAERVRTLIETIADFVPRAALQPSASTSSPPSDESASAPC
ncbi:LysR family transcriptional regulator [Photobacterium sp. CCB-ST2H9]|uniref:LysR family transcriptional regulator n=1 Tax=Photobacterium sp. CCB-ST2H9 TaxID=2912855 RepID=UPI002006AC13|nr:LysR family transcriptional regulator [Photobacterium sp. CCB-ST2H9]UTM56174.1 LysR family transcriptional regulator [Photobacterium sp. CCB-ST2H9]